MDELAPLDALFLHIEDGSNHMHIGSCAVFEGPAPTIDEMTRLVESKLPRLIRYRQKIRFVPGGLGHPVWVDDTHFRVGYHLRHSALPPPGKAEDLENLMGRVMSQPLDRHRPLWEAWMVEGLEQGRWALILDPDRAAATGAVESWSPAPEPSDARLAFHAIGEMVSRPAHSLLAVRRSDVSPTRGWEVAAGLRSLAKIVAPVKPVSVEGSIGPHRRWAAGTCRLDDLKAIRQAFGGSVNDVALAAISGAFRQVLIERGDPVDRATVLRALVPVSVRNPDDHSPNNQVSLMIAELPVGISDAVERFEVMRSKMQGLKASHQVTAGTAIVSGAQLVPPALFAVAAHATMSVLRRRPQHAVNTVTTNVPGPQFPLYALGREMVEYLPFVPISAGARIGVAVISYNGRIAFGVTGDYDTAPDVQFMAKRIEAEIATLRDRAAERPHTKKTRHSAQGTPA